MEVIKDLLQNQTLKKERNLKLKKRKKKIVYLRIKKIIALIVREQDTRLLIVLTLKMLRMKTMLVTWGDSNSDDCRVGDSGESKD